MSRHDIVSPEDQRVTFVELFFDLVFVYAFTQVVALLHHGITWGAVGQAVLVFWLVWWAWTQFTWALNAANTDHTGVQLLTLLATAVAFFLAVAVPDAFQGGAWWFAIPYVAVRAIGLFVYGWVGSRDAALSRAVRYFSLLSVSGLAAVLLGAYVGVPWLYGCWGLAILLDVMAARSAGAQEGWNLHPAHFAERHGLIVIIALGESLIVAAGGLSGAPRTGALLGVGILAVALTSTLWWSYFPYVRPFLEEGLERCPPARRGALGRDVYSLGHFPMVFGIAAVAAATEQAVAHPEVPLATEVRAALAVGLLLFVAGAAWGQRLAMGKTPVVRGVLAVATAAGILALSGVPAWGSLAAALGGMAVLTAWEHHTCRRMGR